MLSEYAAMRQRVITALGEIVNNKKLGEDYSLEKELAESISLAYQAKKSGVKDGEAVSGYALQTNIFTFDDGETVADVLDYVQYDPKKLVRRLEIWVSRAIKDGKITESEGKEFISNYRAGLYGYTYLE